MAGHAATAKPRADLDTQLSTSLRLLGDPVRLRIVELLRQREQCVCHLTDELGLSQGTISHHMRLLKRAGLVLDRRDQSDRRWVYYRLDSEGLAELRRALADLLDNTRTDPTPADCSDRCGCNL